MYPSFDAGCNVIVPLFSVYLVAVFGFVAPSTLVYVIVYSVSFGVVSAATLK